VKIRNGGGRILGVIVAANGFGGSLTLPSGDILTRKEWRSRHRELVERSC
jgi:hypothetical protein